MVDIIAKCRYCHEPFVLAPEVTHQWYCNKACWKGHYKHRRRMRYSELKCLGATRAEAAAARDGKKFNILKRELMVTAQWRSQLG